MISKTIFAIIIVIVVLLIYLASMWGALTYKVLKTTKLSPVSGYEHEWDPLWWKQFDDLEDHNCYDYAFGNVQFEKDATSQPGFLKKMLEDDNETKYTCDLVVGRVLADHPTIKPVDFDTKCGAGEYKIAILASPGHPPYSITSDYHFMRQDSNGMWSHKPGKKMPINVDADGLPIHSPSEANMRFLPFNYNENCGYWCINRTYNQKFIEDDKKLQSGFHLE